MSKKIIIFSVVGAICGLLLAEATNGQRGRKLVSGFGGVYREGELLVRFAPKGDGKQRSVAEKAQVLGSLGGGIEKHRYKLVAGLSLVELAPGRKVENALRAFNNRPEILYAEPNYKLELMSTEPDDPCWADAEDHLWALKKIDANDAWDIATDAGDVIVGVIDTGIRDDHEDLAANMWVNEAELNGTGGVDDDGNGHTDDIYGWNFYADNNNVADEHTLSGNGHGTGIAGMIGGVGNNGKGVVGVCWDVQIMNLKVFPDERLFDPNAFVSGAVAAIEYAVEKDVRVLSNAWGFWVDAVTDPNYDWDHNWGGGALKETIDAAGDAGLLMIFAAGNMGSDNDVDEMYPQNYDCDNIIVVLSTIEEDWRVDTSDYGENTVDLGAPGTPLRGCDSLGGYTGLGGTSFAQAWVSGAAALVWGVNPDLTYREVKDILLDTVDEVEALDGYCVTGGRLNVYKALYRASLHGKSGGFTIKDDSGEPVARFSDSGDLFLAGTLTEDGGQGDRPEATADDEFIVKDSTGNLAIINTTNGDMEIYGDVKLDSLSQWVDPDEGEDEFIIRNDQGDPVAYIDESGNLYLKGNVYGPEP